MPRKVTLWKCLYARFTIMKFGTCLLERMPQGSVLFASVSYPAENNQKGLKVDNCDIRLSK